MGIEQSLSGWYIIESGGDLAKFKRDLEWGYRKGQAFFNALTLDDRARLRSTDHDPFYGGVAKILEAIDFLCTKG